MHPLATLLHGTLHWLSPSGRAVIDALAATCGVSGGASFLARRLGLTNRYALARVLAREGLPPLQDLCAWIRLLGWVLEWERRQAPLGRMALGQNLEPAVCYRLVRRLTGRPWKEARSLGAISVLMDLRDRCRMPASIGVPVSPTGVVAAMRG